jgi:hypothetical protein
MCSALRLKQIMYEIGLEAETRDLTPEILESLLHGGCL